MSLGLQCTSSARTGGQTVVIKPAQLWSLAFPGTWSHQLEEGRVYCDWIVPKAEDTKGGGKKKEEVEQVDVNVECEYRPEGVL